ncbi:MAG: hypothetical protein ACI9T7_002486 [Oleiphilaceae bacterium]|jgi:hypothetical protein
MQVTAGLDVYILQDIVNSVGIINALAYLTAQLRFVILPFR